MKIVITGANGYVGRGLVRLLYGQHDVVAIDSLRFGTNRFQPDELSKFSLETVDITQPEPLAKLLADVQPDVIVHLAAIHYIPECEREPELTVATNVSGTVALLNAAPAGCRFVFASSGAVYAPEERPHDEYESPLMPSDVYGWTKLQGEQWVTHFARERQLAAVIVRLFNVVGPGETNPHLLPEIVAQLKAGRRSISLGNLTSRRDYVHVADVAEGFSACALAGQVDPGELVKVNLATSTHHSVSDVLDMMRRASGIDFEVQQAADRMRAVDRPVLCGQIDRIGNRFGWKPQRDVAMAVTDLWEAPDLREDLVSAYR